MLLEANFDIEQVGGTLEWRFSRKDGNGNPITGKYAGGIYYTVGEEMRVRVRAGSWHRLKSFKVLDCTLITIPQIIEIGPNSPTRHATPSPFVDNAHIDVKGASFNLPGQEFKPSEIQVPIPDYSELALQWGHHMTVGDGVGRWELSMVITVLVEMDDGTKHTRVFSFDPETQVGTGVVPPR